MNKTGKQIRLLQTPYPGPWNNSILYQEGSEIFGESLTDKYKMVQGVQDLELIGAIVNLPIATWNSTIFPPLWRHAVSK